MHSDHHCGGLQISVPCSEALIWQASNKAGRQVVTYLKRTFALMSCRQTKNRDGRQNVTTVDKWSWLLRAACATESHSGRSTFQFLKVDLSSALRQEIKTTLVYEKRRHQSDISPSVSFFKEYCCQAHLWLKCFSGNQHWISRFLLCNCPDCCIITECDLEHLKCSSVSTGFRQKRVDMHKDRGKKTQQQIWSIW